jgi:uncharacterized protein (TIGR02147 family)
MPDYVRQMLGWLKRNEPKFSVRKEAAKLRRCSPALVTHVAAGKRKLTRDRVEPFSKLMRLSAEERAFLEQWVKSLEASGGDLQATNSASAARRNRARRKTGQNHLLCDWLNVYVKDACRIRGFKPDADVVHRLLGGVAPVKRIQRSLAFLFREGFLRLTTDGRVVENDTLVTSTDDLPSQKIRDFHRYALDIAKRGLSTHPMEKRRESALVLPLNEGSFKELREILKDFYERLLVFAEEHPDDDEKLYQVIINLTPVGGQL